MRKQVALDIKVSCKGDVQPDAAMIENTITVMKRYGIRKFKFLVQNSEVYIGAFPFVENEEKREAFGKAIETIYCQEPIMGVSIELPKEFMNEDVRAFEVYYDGNQ